MAIPTLCVNFRARRSPLLRPQYNLSFNPAGSSTQYVGDERAKLWGNTKVSSSVSVTIRRRSRRRIAWQSGEASSSPTLPDWVITTYDIERIIGSARLKDLLLCSSWRFIIIQLVTEIFQLLCGTEQHCVINKSPRDRNLTKGRVLIDSNQNVLYDVIDISL